MDDKTHIISVFSYILLYPILEDTTITGAGTTYGHGVFVRNNTVSMKGCEVTNSAEDGVVLSGEGAGSSVNQFSDGNTSKELSFPEGGGEEIVYVALPEDAKIVSSELSVVPFFDMVNYTFYGQENHSTFYKYGTNLTGWTWSPEFNGTLKTSQAYLSSTISPWPPESRNYTAELYESGDLIGTSPIVHSDGVAKWEDFNWDKNIKNYKDYQIVIKANNSFYWDGESKLKGAEIHEGIAKINNSTLNLSVDVGDNSITEWKR